jgi:glycosyltransferase involved in cell wall biosynthesis
VRVLIDYRPALRARSGVGEYTYRLARALLVAFPPRAAGRSIDLTLFSSSWTDRVPREDGIATARVIDRRVPVRVLNLAWHRLGWPSAETFAGDTFDVAHSPHPLLLPARSAARVVTIHDLYFLEHPDQAHAEIRRDYPALTRRHAHRADHIIVPSRFTAGEVERRLEVPADRVSVCPHGRPDWAPRTTPPPEGGYLLFLGTLEPRKNVGGLLDAYERLIHRILTERTVPRRVPELVLAGQMTNRARPWLDRLAKPPLAGRARYVGYIEPAQRRELYAGACLLIQPSFEEGFGLPVLEAMTLGIPVVAANRGALPEILGDAGLLVEPGDSEQMAVAIDRMLTDPPLAASSSSRGLLRAQQFDWRQTAECVYEAYHLAIEQRRCASA